MQTYTVEDMKTYTMEEFMKLDGMSKKDYQLRRKWYMFGWNACEKMIKRHLKEVKPKNKIC